MVRRPHFKKLILRFTMDWTKLKKNDDSAALQLPSKQESEKIDFLISFCAWQLPVVTSPTKALNYFVSSNFNFCKKNHTMTFTQFSIVSVTIKFWPHYFYFNIFRYQFQCATPRDLKNDMVSSYCWKIKIWNFNLLATQIFKKNLKIHLVEMTSLKRFVLRFDQQNWRKTTTALRCNLQANKNQKKIDKFIKFVFCLAAACCDVMLNVIELFRFQLL